jgi:hypothetical protein
MMGMRRESNSLLLSRIHSQTMTPNVRSSPHNTHQNRQQRKMSFYSKVQQGQIIAKKPAEESEGVISGDRYLP